MDRPPKKSINTGEWLNTYADMVTLILCFFVLLYSMSSVDAAKWEAFVKSINPYASPPPAISANELDAGGDSLADAPNELEGDKISEAEKTFEDIYEMIKEAIEERGLQEVMEVFKGEEFAFVVFRNNVFFDGDRYELRPEGKVILDDFVHIISGLDNEIGGIRVLGHTTQLYATRDNTVKVDRFLSSNRATEVTVYIQERCDINPKKIIPEGLGQHYPVSPIDTEENRSKNRRVEILIAKTGNMEIPLEDVYNTLDIEVY